MSVTGSVGRLCRCARLALLEEALPFARDAASSLVAALLGVALDPRRRKGGLQPLHIAQRLAQPLVLDNSRVLYPLVLVEGGVGQGNALPAQFQAAIREGVGVHVLPGQATRHRRLLQHDPLALIAQGQLVPDMALLAVTQDLAQPLRAHLQRSMPIRWPGRDDSE